jgi:deazaflavin-dependent oxidoreductase (nitroreductase family)
MTASCHTNESTALDITRRRVDSGDNEPRAVLSKDDQEHPMNTPKNSTPNTPVDPTRYVAPGGRMDTWSAAVVRWLTARGISLYGSRVLVVRGRKSGEPRSNPVNLLELDGERYLVAPRGNTQWVRNVRAAGRAELHLGRRAEPVLLTEVPVEDRLPVLRVYLERWGWEVGRFVEGLTKGSTDAEVMVVAPGMPVFRVTTAPATTP